jgi:hypothetical protein
VSSSISGVLAVRPNGELQRRCVCSLHDASVRSDEASSISGVIASRRRMVESQTRWVYSLYDAPVQPDEASSISGRLAARRRTANCRDDASVHYDVPVPSVS